ncbi:PP0621 family protein [Accumulibacter sp.]|uniref:PP0621 family protein n=1 Tax=Accumulibacter sp. TaxID=2053492 RepID=UPI0035B20A7D
MTKYLLLIGLVWVLWWFWRKSRTSARGSAANHTTVQREAERMVQCTRCGVNQPVSESILADGRYYCCAAHRDAGASDDS